MLMTARLNLRKWTLHALDADAWHEIWGDPEVIWWGPNPDRAKSVEQLQEIIERIEGMDPGLGWWALVDNKTGHICGNVCIQPSKAVDGHIEIGWHIMKRAQGSGFATEAAEALIAFAFERLDIERLVAPIVPTNEPSQRVAAKLGFARGEKLEYWGLEHDIWRLERSDFSVGAS